MTTLTSSRAIRRTTTAVVVVVAASAAVISYRHAYEVVRAHGETGWTAGLVPLSIDGLIAAASMVILDAARQRSRVPPLAYWLLGLGILATLCANVAHGLAYGITGALVAGWPAVALVGAYELLMRLVRSSAATPAEERDEGGVSHECTVAMNLEDAVRAAYEATLSRPGKPISQRALAHHFETDRRRVGEALAGVAQPSPNGQHPQEPVEAVT